MGYKAVLFDLDGTLLDTLEDLKNAVNFALRRRGYPEISLRQTRGFVGNGVRLLVERALPEGANEREIDECLSDFKREYDAYINVFTHPYDGVKDVLRALRARGVRTGVVSNKYDSAAKELVAAHFGELIDSCLGTFPDIPSKPAPDTALMLLDQFGATAKEAIYVGDSGVDMQTAKNAGLPFIGVSWGFWGRERLREAGAERIEDTAEELLRALSE